ncbi:MAG: tetratricopeptide repeat protein [Thermoanaerobaculia bacterium]|nr:tetratricopeptide repeat protein [Thermoanaerobaculia bacterium]
MPAPRLDGVEPRVRDKVERSREEVLRDPDDPDLWGAYAVVLDAHSLAAEAILAYREAARLDPESSRWPYLLATLLEYEDPEAAVDWFTRAVRARPSYAPARIRYAQTLEAVGRDAEAENEYRAAAELDPTDYLSHLGLGRLALAGGRVDEAISHLERAYRLEDDVQAVVATLARAYARAGREEDARVKAQEARGLPRALPHRDPVRAAVDEEAVDTASYLRRSRTNLDVNRPERALEEIEELLSFAPDNGEAWFAAAGVHDRLGDPSRALFAARRALELDPGLEGVREVVAGALFKLRRFDEANEIVAAVLEEKPDNVHMRVLAAMCAVELGSVEEVISHLDHAYRVRTHDNQMASVMIELFVELAAAFADVGSYADAAARMTQALELAQESGASPQRLREYRQQLERYRRGQP